MRDSNRKDVTRSNALNPFDVVTPQELEQYAGQFVAINRDGTGIVDAAPTFEGLVAKMTDRPEIRYRVFPVGNLAGITREEYVAQCQAIGDHEAV